jgi:hypothetical protein
MWEMLNEGAEPFSDLQIFEIPHKVIAGVRPPIPPQADKRFVDIMKLCWQPNPADRPSFAELEKMFEPLINELTQEFNDEAYAGY